MKSIIETLDIIIALAAEIVDKVAELQQDIEEKRGESKHDNIEGGESELRIDTEGSGDRIRNQ